MKIVAVVIGLFVAALVHLSYTGWVDVKWAAMEDTENKKHINECIRTGCSLNTATQFASHPFVAAASGLPIAAMFGFIPGIIMGLKKG